MKLSEVDCFVLSSAIEHLYLTNGKKCLLNEKGIKKLANIYSRLGQKLFKIDQKAVQNDVEQRMLKEINYTKEE